MRCPHNVTFKVKFRDNSNTFFFSYQKGTHMHVFLYKIGRIYVSYQIFFDGGCFVLSYSTHMWNAYVAGDLLKIKKREK